MKLKHCFILFVYLYLVREYLYIIYSGVGQLKYQLVIFLTIIRFHI